MNEKSNLLNQLRIDRTAAAPASSRATFPRPVLWGAVGAVVVLAALLTSWFVFADSGAVPVHAVIAKALASEGADGGSPLLDASGYVTPRLEATISSNIIAKVIAVPIEEGEHVKKGQLLAQLDDTIYKASLEQAKAAAGQAAATLAAAKVAVADAEPIYQRDVRQLAQELISHETFDGAKATYDAAKTAVQVAAENLEAARAGVEAAESNYAYTKIYAPFDGVVTVKTAVPGNLVSYSFTAGAGICTLVDMDSLEVWVDVSENFINRVKPHMPATITLNAYPDWQIPAEVVAVIPTADQAKATVKVRVGFKQMDDRVLPHMGARVSFMSDAPVQQTGSAPPARGVIVPTEAVQTNGDKGIVFVIKDKTVQRREVQLGARNADGQVVLSGIAPGDSLAIGDSHLLADGVKVKAD